MRSSTCARSRPVCRRPICVGRPLGLATTARRSLSASWLDRQLAAGVPSWRSHTHAARAVRLTSAPTARGAREIARAACRTCRAAGPEAESRPSRRAASRCATRCRRSWRSRRGCDPAEPLDARGVAMLRALLADGGGPCYVAQPPSRAHGARCREVSQMAERGELAAGSIRRCTRDRYERRPTAAISGVFHRDGRRRRQDLPDAARGARRAGGRARRRDRPARDPWPGRDRTARRGTAA